MFGSTSSLAYIFVSLSSLHLLYIARISADNSGPTAPSRAKFPTLEIAFPRESHRSNLVNGTQKSKQAIVRR